MNRGRMKNLAGLVASPVAYLKEGQPTGFRWIVTSVVRPGGSETATSVPEDGWYNLGFRAGKLFVDAPEDAHGQAEFDLRQVAWAENSFGSDWQSYAQLGGSMGMR